MVAARKSGLGRPPHPLGPPDATCQKIEKIKLTFLFKLCPRPADNTVKVLALERLCGEELWVFTLPDVFCIRRETGWVQSRTVIVELALVVVG